MKELKIHPLAEIFPPIPEEDQKQLTQSIAESGLLFPIVVFEGKILDGRHRYFACKETGVKPRFEEYKGKDPVSFVRDANLNRRHLSQAQKAMAAAKLQTTTWGSAARLEEKSSKTPMISQDANLHLGSHPPVTRNQAAQTMGVSPRSVATASNVLKEAPDLAEQVAQGQISLNAADQKTKERQQQSTPSKPPAVRDETGWPVPDPLHGLWARKNEVLKLMKQIASLDGMLATVQKEKDVLFSGFDFCSVRTRLQQVHMELRTVQLYAVCTNCSGRNPESCKLCKGRGILSKFAWDTFVPQEVKTIRERSKK